MVEEAGGMVTGVDGRPPILADKLALVASNGLIQEEMLAVLAGVGL
jgi:fructose-1,6-bisphosphatase/inositol monophosphatase family enzyme